MPSSLKRHLRDPNKLGRGTGLYYHRGKGYHSKYSKDRDAKIQAKGFKIHPIGLPGKAKLLHTGDGHLTR